jgi:hypothetical protein
VGKNARYVNVSTTGGAVTGRDIVIPDNADVYVSDEERRCTNVTPESREGQGGTSWLLDVLLGGSRWALGLITRR